MEVLTELHPNSEKAYSELIEKIKRGEIRSKDELEIQKVIIARKYNLVKLIKNSELISYSDDAAIAKLLKTKPVRTLSGVANIAVMWLGDLIGDSNFSCPFSCVFCPQGKHAVSDTIVSVPKSYTGTEPTTLRAMRNHFDPYKQIKNRLKQFHLIGHKTDKCELIIMGGTFMAWNKAKREQFILECFNAFNDVVSQSLQEAHQINESSLNRVIGLTIETRGDYCSEKQINEMLSYGCTRVEIGVQSTSELLLQRMKRGHDTLANKKAFQRLRNAGLKVCAHWMPGLTGMVKKDLDWEIETFRELFDDPAYRPDELKIYPTLVIPETELHEMWQRGEYEPLTYHEGTELLMKLKSIVPRYVRIKRIMRDISEHEAVAGARRTNLRQLLSEQMRARGLECNCIRCREVGLKGKCAERIELVVDSYEASDGAEYFLSFEDTKNKLIIGFLRMRIDDSDIAKVRELHVYGQMIPIGENSNAFQHKGFGRALLQKAEEITLTNGKKKIQITSGAGVRNYYKKLGYELSGYYMVKNLA